MPKLNLTAFVEEVKEEPKMAVQALIILFGFMFLGFYHLYKPKAKEFETKERAYKRIESEHSRINAENVDVDDLRLEIEDLKRKTSKISKLFYKRSEIADFLRRIGELVASAGIKVRTISPGKMTPIKLGEIEAESFSVSFTFRGDLVNLGIFLRLAELEEKIVFLKLPPLIPNQEGIFEFELYPTTILLDEEFSDL